MPTQPPRFLHAPTPQGCCEEDNRPRAVISVSFMEEKREKVESEWEPDLHTIPLFPQSALWNQTTKRGCTPLALGLTVLRIIRTVQKGANLLTILSICSVQFSHSSLCPIQVSFTSSQIDFKMFAKNPQQPFSNNLLPVVHPYLISTSENT